MAQWWRDYFQDTLYCIWKETEAAGQMIPTGTKERAQWLRRVSRIRQEMARRRERRCPHRLSNPPGVQCGEARNHRGAHTVLVLPWQPWATHDAHSPSYVLDALEYRQRQIAAIRDRKDPYVLY